MVRCMALTVASIIDALAAALLSYSTVKVLAAARAVRDVKYALAGLGMAVIIAGLAGEAMVIALALTAPSPSSPLRAAGSRRRSRSYTR